MYRVNLIKGWQKTETYKNYRNRLLYGLLGVSFLMIFGYVALFVRFLLLQNELTDLTNQQFLHANGKTYNTETLTKTIYSLKKLAEIKSIYVSYPDYYQYHQFLLKQIFRYSTFTLENYALNKEHIVNVSLRSKSIDDLFEFMNTMESPKVSSYFSEYEIKAIQMNESRDHTDRSFLLDFTIKFNDKLLYEKK